MMMPDIAGFLKARRVLRVWRESCQVNASCYNEDGIIAKKMIHTRVPCSNVCCGNPRRHFGQRTRQELIHDDIFAAELDYAAELELI